MKLTLLTTYVCGHPLRDLPSLVKVEILEKNLTHRFHAHDFAWQIHHGDPDGDVDLDNDSKRVDFIKVNLNLRPGASDPFQNDHEHTTDTVDTGEKSAELIQATTTNNPFVSIWTNDFTSAPLIALSPTQPVSTTTTAVETARTTSSALTTEEIEATTNNDEVATVIPLVTSQTTGTDYPLHLCRDNYIDS